MRGSLTSIEFVVGERSWIAAMEQPAFPDEKTTLKGVNEVSKGRLLLLYPFLDENGLMCVGGRTHQSMETCNKRHPFVMPTCSKQPITRMIIRYEHVHNRHVRLLQAGPTLITASLARQFAIAGAQ